MTREIVFSKLSGYLFGYYLDTLWSLVKRLKMLLVNVVIGKHEQIG